MAPFCKSIIEPNGFVKKIIMKTKALIPVTTKYFNVIKTTRRLLMKPASAVQHTLHPNYSTQNAAKFDFKPCKLFKLDKGPESSALLDSAEALKLYIQMVLSRRLEVVCGNLYKAKLIRGFCHLYIGQEAVAVGIRAALRDVDTVITSYRCHVWTYLMGVSPGVIFAELFGKKNGCSKGKGGSMHMYAKNFFGGNGIVGAQVPLGAGVAFAHKYRGDGGVCFALYGDGAANQGQLHEALNMAKLWNLPIVFLCENNKYAMGTQTNRASASTEYYRRGDYVPGVWVDGMDVLATREATRFAIDYCSSGKGPLVMEMETYRYQGHSMSDPGTSYRSRDEVAEVRKTRDPIANLKERILSSKLATAEQLKEIDVNVRKEMDEAAELAKSGVEPAVEDVATDIYFKNYHPYIRGVYPGALLQHVENAPRNLVMSGGV